MNPLPDQLYGRKFDLVFSWVTLMYVHPLRIKNAIKNILHLSSNEVIFIEQNSTELNSYHGYLGKLVKHEPTWIRNYPRILSKFSEIFVDSFTIESVPSDIWYPGGGGGTLIKYKLREVDDF